MFFPVPDHTKAGDSMPDTQNFLSSISAQAQRGQLRIGAILETAVHTELRKVLLLQRKEYRMIEARAHQIASARGLSLRGAEPLLLYLSCRLVKLRLWFSKSDVPAAAFMIQSCTQGMIGSLQVLHRCPQPHCPVRGLAQKLADCERSCILQLQGFL